MRAPPPQFQPPSPPVDDHQYQRDLMISTLPTDDDDDSHYETPDRHTSLVVGGSILDNRAFHGESSSLITTPLSTALTARPGVSGTMRNGNCYRPPPSLGNEEERHQFLQRNPDTGAYFIPSYRSGELEVHSTMEIDMKRKEVSSTKQKTGDEEARSRHSFSNASCSYLTTAARPHTWVEPFVSLTICLFERTQSRLDFSSCRLRQQTRHRNNHLVGAKKADFGTMYNMGRTVLTDSCTTLMSHMFVLILPIVSRIFLISSAPGDDYADGYWSVQHPPPPTMGSFRRPPSSDDDLIMVVGTSASLGGQYAHRPRRFRQPRSASHLDSASSVPLYDEVSAQTTTSTLSPQSRRTDKSCGGRSSIAKNMNYNLSTNGVPRYNYESLHKQNMITSNSSSGSSASQPLRTRRSSLRRHSKSGGMSKLADVFSCGSKSHKSNETFYRRVAIVFGVIILLLALVLGYLFYQFKNIESKYVVYDESGSVYYNHNLAESQRIPYMEVGEDGHRLLALPESFRLGEFVHADLPPGQIVYTKFSVQHDSPIQFNISVGPKARIALYARQTLRPSLTAYDYTHIIRGDHLHVAGAVRRLRRSVNSFKSTVVTFELLSGKWNLGIFNDGTTPQAIGFVASTVKKELPVTTSVAAKSKKTCKYHCFSKGVCKEGKCHCHPGYSGDYCEETACPVLCSGNGIFTNGRCNCHDGFKGPDCDIDARWCAVPNCNHHGQCDSNGRCICDRGWTGEFCELRDCDDPTCSNNGICQNATCYCGVGWYGKHCEQRISTACSPLDVYHDAPINQADFYKQDPFTTSQPVAVKSQPTNFKVQNDLPIFNEPVAPVKKTFDQSRCNNRGEFDSSTSKCNCFDGWTGSTCELQECASECVHGICNDGQCLCDPQYTGTDCSQKQCLPGCEKHGVCNNGVCECNPGWNGENCFIEGCPNNCSNTGTCQQFKGAWQCACDSSHYGPHCEYAMETSCDDGIDNDDDGLVDCEDSECCSHQACSDKNPLCTKVVQPRSVLLRIQAPTDASFFQRNHFLIEPESVQRFADVSLFNESRAAIIRGEVVSSKGGPLTSVRVSDTANPRFGFSLTRGEGDTGAFDIMVNGGGFVTLQFLRQPFGKVEKSFYVPANDIINVGKIYMNEVSSPEFNKESISPECQEHHLKHVYAPKIMPSWILRQYAGGFNDNNEDITRVVADARVVLDSIPIAGTNEMEMIYSSDRADGFQSTLHIALLPADISPSLRLVHVKIQLAGQEFKSLLVAKPKLVHTFHWNHLNVYSQTVYGLNLASVSIGYEYEDCSTDSEIVWHHEQIKIEGRKAPKNALGLWSLNFHHHFDPLNNVLQRGDGLTQYLGELSMISRTLVGSEKQREAVCSESCLKQSIDSANLFLPTSLAIASDGTLYIGDFNVIRRVKPDRSSIDVVLELSSADISSAYYLAVDPSTDKLYISIPQRRQIWMLKKTDRIDDITTNYKIVIGDGATCTDMDGSCGDGGPAESAQLNFPKDITFGNSGNMFILDGRRIRYVTKDRVINTLVGVPVKKSADNCATIFRMNELALEWPLSIVFEPTSSDLIVLDADVIYRLNTCTGVVKTLAGIVKACTNQDLSHLDGAQALSIDPKLGVIYIAETDSKKHNFVRSLPVNGGRLTTVAGIASKCDCDRVNCPCDDPLGKPPAIATQSFLHKPVSLIVDAHGRLYVADQANFKIKLVEHVSATFESSNRTYVINSPSTNEVFHFNQHGLHQMTTSLLSGQELYRFKYSVDTRFGMLSEITTPGGFSMRLSRMNETDVILDGTMPHKTLVRMHTFDRQLVQMVQVLTTDGKTVEFDYENGQLLKTRRSLDRTFFFEYDAAGRVTTMSTSTGETYSFDSDYSLNNVLNTDVHLNGQRFRRFIASNDDFSEEGSSSKLFTSLPNSFIYENEEAKSTFDAVTHPLLRPHESAILKRKVVLPSTEEPMRREIRSRFEWRTAVHTDEGKNVIQINGRNAFTIEFDRQLARDIVRDAYDNDILTITYTPSGLIAKVEVLGALNLEPFSGTYDSHGLPLSYTWGELRQDFAYDAFQRLIANTFSRKGDLLVRRYTYGSDSSPNPSMVTMPSGNMFKWLYNSDGGVASLKSPSDEVIDFWGVRGIQNDAAAIYYRRSKAGHFNGVATAIYNSKGDLMEFVNLNGNERVSVKRDVYGRIVRIQSGKYNINIEYDQFGRVSKASTNSIMREYIYQGPLVVAMKRTSDKGGSAVYFSTEYDDLFRQTTIHINVNGTALEPLKLEYDHLTGYISKIGRCIFTSSNGVQRISNDAFVYDSEYSTTRQLKKVTLIVGGLTVIQFQSAYDTVGRLESTIWTVQDETRPTETHAYAVDGGLSEYALSSRANKQIWHSYYDASGRLVKINDDTIEIGSGGIARRVGQLNYTTDNNGWTLRRGAFLFDYDALGQLRRATHTRNRAIDIVYEYDEKNRIIARRYLHSGRVQRFYYALADANDLITHFTDSSIVDSVWTIHYNNEKTPYLLECSSGTSHIIVTDPTGSIRFIVNEQGSIDRELGYSTTGDAVFDTKMDLYFPLGYLGKFHDVETGIVFVSNYLNGIPVTRPMDSKLGRYMSTSLNMVFNQMNAFRPEEITDPFMFEHNHKAVEIPATPNEWLLLTGTNVKNLIPFTKLDLDSENTCIKSAVVSGAICAAEDQLRFLSQVMTMQPTKFMGLTSSHLSSSLIHNPVRVGINDNSLGSAGLSINYDKDNNVHLLISNYIDISVSNVLTKVLSNTSFVLQTFVMPEPRLNNTGYFEIHLVKVGAANNAEDDLHVKLNTKLFNITLKKTQLVEIASEETTIFVHYQGTPTKIRKTAINRIVTSMEQRVWSAERAALKRSTVTIHRWNEKQRQELLSSGRVRGFVPRPSNPENLDIVQNIEEWKFKPI
uniref:Teneurin-m n=1 Tax=Panagrellus redivivus TaxID=6233 RepID=A0A7E4W009_PANRE